MTSLATALSQKMVTFPREHISTKPFNSLTFKPYNNPTKFIFKIGIRSEGNGSQGGKKLKLGISVFVRTPHTSSDCVR